MWLIGYCKVVHHLYILYKRKTTKVTMMGRSRKYICKPRISNRMMSLKFHPRKYGTASIPMPHKDLMNTANIRARMIGLLWRVNFDMKELVFISKLYSV